ncbi:hypothetical protein RJT34_14155 [Clitoria ternatea]|uniref:Peptidase A1 domain-containing protein n=1 Tax=Clitoria ternatea TaxID=43366 RepID=A0AAN9JSG0_CLITE
MASSFSSSLLLLPLLFSLLCLQASSSSFSLPLTKDASTLQYLTTLSHGTPLVPTNLVLDLGGPLLWLDCSSPPNTPSSSLSAIFLRSIRCLTAKSPQIETRTWLSSLANPADQDHPCHIPTENTITGKRVFEGELVEDLVVLLPREESRARKIQPSEHQILFVCSPSLLLNGLATGAKGIVGLGRSRTSFSSQVFHSLTTHRKFALCLSPSSGAVLFGKTGFESQPGSESEILRSLTFTPLVTNQDQTHPSINVNSIKINGKRVSFNAPSLSQLSTVVPYTTMQSSIYANFKSAYLKAALSVNMTQVPPVAPFGLCFKSNGIGVSQVGPNVPVIDLVMQSEMVKWSIYGRNSMVQVSNGVMCLGFLDGGLNPGNPIVIGGYQMEDVLLQFDFDTSMVGFSSSLLMRGTSCSDSRFGSMAA